MSRKAIPPWGRCSLLWFSLLICVLIPGIANAQPDLKVFVSIKPMHSILTGLMVDLAPPTLIIAGRQLPYEYKATPEQVKKLQDADLVIWVGPELEPGLVDTLASLNHHVKVIELLSHQGLKVLSSRSQPDQRDPYFWLDNRNVMILLDDLTKLLQDLDPQRAHVYERNRRTVLSRLARIDREYEYGYRGMKAGLGVQYYDTLQYFEQAYALKILDHVAASPKQATSAAALLKVRARLMSGEAVCLLTEEGLPVENLSLLLQDSQANHGVLDSLGLGMTAGPNLYFDLMDHNTDVIKVCLNADMQVAAAAREQAQREDAVALEGIGSGQFLLTDHLGRLVSKESMLGKYPIVYFGYTYCPDICPTSLQVMLQALDLLGEKADQFQAYFITIDPERDSIGVMRNYVQYYDQRLIGVTGSRDMIDRVATQFKARYAKVTEEDDDPSSYLMDHTASLYVLNPQGEFITKFAHGIEPEMLAEQLRALLEP